MPDKQSPTEGWLIRPIHACYERTSHYVLTYKGQFETLCGRHTGRLEGTVYDTRPDNFCTKCAKAVKEEEERLAKLGLSDL
jgi:hypothetical protein